MPAANPLLLVSDRGDRSPRGISPSRTSLHKRLRRSFLRLYLVCASGQVAPRRWLRWRERNADQREGQQRCHDIKAGIEKQHGRDADAVSQAARCTHANQQSDGEYLNI